MCDDCLAGCMEALGMGAPAPPPGLLVEGGIYNDYLRGLWVEKGASKGIDDGQDQGKVETMIGTNNRSKLNGRDRDGYYQCVLSFPGAGFDFTFTDEDGVEIASSGWGLALKLRRYISKEIAGGDEAIAVNNIYFDWKNLQFVPGTTAVMNYQGRGTTASINPNWKFYYVEAQLECNVMVILCTAGWLKSKYCLGEFDDLAEIVEKNPEGFATKELLFVLLEDVSKDPVYQKIKGKCDELEAQVIEYFPNMSAEAKGQAERHIIGTIDRVCQEQRPLTFRPKVIVEKTVEWDTDAMGDGRPCSKDFMKYTDIEGKYKVDNPSSELHGFELAIDSQGMLTSSEPSFNGKLLIAGKSQLEGANGEIVTVKWRGGKVIGVEDEDGMFVQKIA